MIRLKCNSLIVLSIGQIPVQLRFSFLFFKRYEMAEATRLPSIMDPVTP